MIQEAYCSFEVAKLLKEKGFDEICTSAYSKITKKVESPAISEWAQLNQIKRPTHQMSLAWLREEHNIFIIIEPRSHIAKTSTYMFGMWIKSTYEQHFERFFSYEEAVEAALKYALKNLI